MNKSEHKSKKELVHAALRNYLRKLELMEFADMKGKVKWEGDLNEMRKV